VGASVGAEVGRAVGVPEISVGCVVGLTAVVKVVEPVVVTVVVADDVTVLDTELLAVDVFVVVNVIVPVMVLVDVMVLDTTEVVMVVVCDVVGVLIAHSLKVPSTYEVMAEFSIATPASHPSSYLTKLPNVHEKLPEKSETAGVE